MVKTQCFQLGTGLIFDQGTKILQAMQHGPKKKNLTNMLRLPQTSEAHLEMLQRQVTFLKLTLEHFLTPQALTLHLPCCHFWFEKNPSNKILERRDWVTAVPTVH